MKANAIKEKNDLFSWLLEEDNSSVRYFTLTKVLRSDEVDAGVIGARRQIQVSGPVQEILALQNPAGWWDNPDDLASPMYVSTIWQLIFLAELGAGIGVESIRRAAELVFSTVHGESGSFELYHSFYPKTKPSDLLCYDAMIAWSLLRLGCPMQDERIVRSVNFLAEVLIEAGPVCRYNKDFACAWGGVKALRALAEVPEALRTEKVQQAITQTVEFLLSRDLSAADYPTKPGGKISQHWFTLGFPRSYQADILQTLVVLADLGYIRDRRLNNALDWLEGKQLPEGAWPLEYTITKMPVQFGKKSKRKPSKWITWQAIYVLSQAGRF